MDYLRWAKVHQPVRYELTASGVPPVRHDGLPGPSPDVSLEVHGSYGDPEILEALATRYGIASEGIVPVPGASSANFIALATAVSHGDTILMEEPVYQPIRRVAEFFDCTVIPVMRRPEALFQPNLQAIEARLTHGVSALVLTNLHNPSGQLLSQSSLATLAERCRATGAKLIVDEVYLDGALLTAGRAPWTAGGLSSSVIAINSLTKVYGLGGLRVGWILTDPVLAERARTIMDLLSVNNAAPSAAFARHAFAHMDHLEARYRRFFHQGQPVFRRWLEGEPLVQGYPSHGALFELVRLPKGVSSRRLNEHLVARYETQVVPGQFFNLDDHIRLSIALPPDDLAEALFRVSSALADLHNL